MTKKALKVVVPDGTITGKARVERALRDLGNPNIELVYFADTAQTEDEWVSRVEGADAVILNWRLPDAVLRSCPTLQVVSFLGTGVGDNVNVKLAEEVGVEIQTVSGYGNNAVAEHALALLFAVNSDIAAIDRQVREGKWPQPSRHELRGKRVGIVGVGGIGIRFAELTAACGMEVVGWSRSLQSGRIVPGITSVALEELFSTSDVVSIHLGLNDETQRMIGENLLQLMKPGSIFINTARAGVVDTTALLKALEDEKIGAAGIDVYDVEPAAKDDPMLTAPRVTLASHIGYSSEEAKILLFEGAVQNIMDHFKPDLTPSK